MTRLRSPWRLIYVAIASVFFLVAFGMAPVWSKGSWESVDGTSYSSDSLVIAIVGIACGVLMLVLMPSPVIISSDTVSFRERTTRRKIALSQILGVEVRESPSEILRAVVPALILSDKEILLANLVGYTRGSSNKRVERQVSQILMAIERYRGGISS